MRNLRDEQVVTASSVALKPPATRSAYLGPNWFATVMGTGIVANAGATLPFEVPLLKEFCLVVWIIAASLLAGLLVATAYHWLASPQLARSHGHDVQMAHFYGALPMALLTVGAGALLAAHSLLGTHVAVDIDWALWSLGTAGGLVTATLIPYRLFTEIEVRPDAAFGGWLMPIVPPMVSAATGALLIPYVASAAARATLLYGCYALFGMSLVAAFIVITQIWSRLAHYGSSNSARVPTLWIVLGPLGQSITAAGNLGAQAHLAVAAPLAQGMRVFAVMFGVPVWGFAMLWGALAVALTLRTIRKRLPFSLTWWSFTFPVGVTVTGTIRLAVQTGLPAFRWASATGFVFLLAAWIVVATRTSHAAVHGHLFHPPSRANLSTPASKDQRRATEEDGTFA